MSYEIGQRDQRPWGTWEVLDVGSGYAVKRIVVHPGKRLSLQRHQFRTELWVMVAGSGKVTRNEALIPVREGDTASIGQGDVHRIENSGENDLVFIEVQRGARLEENDIERLEDDYGRLRA